MPTPREEQSETPLVHSKDKLDFICMLMAAWHKTARDMESDLAMIKLPWWNGEPVPDHTTISKHLQTIPHGFARFQDAEVILARAFADDEYRIHSALGYITPNEFAIRSDGGNK